MRVYIGIEDLVANALIAILHYKNEKFVSFQELENYGSSVVTILSQKGEKAILILSRESTDALFRNYSDFFEAATMDGLNGIGLKNDITVDDLEESFRGYLSLDVLKAFIDKSSVSQLGVGV